MPPELFEDRGNEKPASHSQPGGKACILRLEARVFVKRYYLLLVILTCSAAAFAAEPAPTKWTVDGVEREALVFSPSHPSAKAPVIFAFHGHGGNMHLAASAMAFQNFWPEAIVIYPQGFPSPSLFPQLEKKLLPGWQRDPGALDDRDLKFVDAILRTLHEKYRVDDRRIYATGFSNGGFFTYLLWAMRPDVFAAFAPGAATIRPTVHPVQPRPLLHYGGENDRLIPIQAQRRAIEFARRLNRCSDFAWSCGDNCSHYSSPGQAPVEAYIHPGGHVYPAAVSTEIVRFFRNHPRNS
jgi:polyhydroxybutyrate depolymerase